MQACISALAHRLMQNASPAARGSGDAFCIPIGTHTLFRILNLHFQKKEYFMPTKNYRITVSLPADLTYWLMVYKNNFSFPSDAAACQALLSCAIREYRKGVIDND